MRKRVLTIIFIVLLLILLNETAGFTKNKSIEDIRIGIHKNFRRIAIDVSDIPSYNIKKYNNSVSIILKDIAINPKMQVKKYYKDTIINNYVIKKTKNTVSINFKISKNFTYKVGITRNPNVIFVDIYPSNKETTYTSKTPLPNIKKTLPPISNTTKVSNMILTEKDQWGNGIFNSFFFYFSKDQNWVIKNGKINLVVSHSDITLSSTSSFTVYLNGVPIKSVKLDDSNKLKANIEFNLPLNKIKDGTNEILIKVYLRSLSDPCQDIDNPSVWFKIHKESIIHLEYILKENLTLKDYPMPFFEPPLTSPLKSIILLPDTLTPSEIACAYSIISHWGQLAPYTKFYPTIAYGNKLSIDDKNKHIIFIGLWENLSGDIKNLIKKQLKEEPSEGKSYLGIIQSPYNFNKRMLYIVGKTDKDIIRGVKALIMEHSKKQLIKNPSIIDDKITLEEKKISLFEEEYITFKDLGYENILLEGAFHQSTHMYYEIPTAWKLKSGAYMKIYLKHAITLSPEKSILTITLNGVPVYSIKLTEKNANGSEIYIPLTKETLKNKYLDIGFNAYLDLDVKDCTRIYPEAAWILIKGTSILYLPHTIAPYKFSLKFLPNLYIEKQKIDNLNIIFTEKPNKTLLKILSTIIASWGSGLQGFTMPKVEILTNVNNDVLKRIEKQKNIFIGPPRSFLNSIYKELVFYDKKEDRYVSQKYTLLPDYTRNATLIQLSRKDSLPATVIYETKNFKPSFTYLNALSYWPNMGKLNGRLSLVSHSGDVINFEKEKVEEEGYENKLERYFDFIQKIGRRRAIISIFITLIGLSILFVATVLYREYKNR